MIEAVGWAGNLLFAICGLPQAIKTWKSKNVSGLSGLFLWMWLIGELLTFVYILVSDLRDNLLHIPLYFNYAFNLVLAGYLVWAKYAYPKKYKDAVC